MKLTLPLLVSLSLICTHMAHAQLLNIAPESVEAEAWMIYDPQTEQTIAAHQADHQRAPASLTKMMVAYIALKDIQQGHLHLDEKVTVSSVVQQVRADESQMRLKVSTQVDVDTLLAGLTVMSANDAALVLAERISGSVDAFVSRMNQEAHALGMQNTHFQNPAGISMPEHYSTAADLVKLSTAVIEDTPYYLHYAGLPKFQYANMLHPATNLLLARDASVNGLKTGFTKAAGYNLALSAKRKNEDVYSPERRLIVVVLGTKSIAKRAEVTHKLLDVAYTYSQNQTLLSPGTLVAQLPVQKSAYTWFNVKIKHPVIVTTSLYAEQTPLNLKQFDQQKQRLYQNLPQQKVWIQPVKAAPEFKLSLNEQTLSAPLQQDIKLAKLQIYQNQQLLQQTDIENHVELESLNIFQQSLQWLHDRYHRIERQAKILL